MRAAVIVNPTKADVPDLVVRVPQPLATAA
jgi:hypothetical protein